MTDRLTNGSNIEYLLDQALVSDVLKDRLLGAVDRWDSNHRAQLEASLEKGRLAAAELIKRAKSLNSDHTENSIKIDYPSTSEISDEILKILVRSLPERFSGFVTAGDVYSATQIVKTAADEAITRVLSEYASRRTAKYIPAAKPDISLKFDPNDFSVAPYPISTAQGYARPSDIHFALATAEHLARESAPDAIVAVNNGGAIIGAYLRQRLSRGVERAWSSLGRPSKVTASTRFTTFTQARFKNLEGRRFKSVLIVDDISRSGKTISRVREEVQKIFSPQQIISFTLISTYQSLEFRKSDDYSSFLSEDFKIKMPYDSRGSFESKNGINILGRHGADLSITDHEADLFLKDINNRFRI